MFGVDSTAKLNSPVCQKTHLLIEIIQNNLLGMDKRTSSFVWVSFQDFAPSGSVLDAL